MSYHRVTGEDGLTRVFRVADDDATKITLMVRLPPTPGFNPEDFEGINERMREGGVDEIVNIDGEYYLAEPSVPIFRAALKRIFGTN